MCTNLSTIIKKHDVINHIKDELKNIDFNDEFTFEKFNSLISAEISNDFLKELLNELSELSKTDLKNEDYSIKEIIKNSLSNTNFFLTTLLINHLVITASSAYTAETLTWESYKEDIVSINNIISTIVRATVMKFVNECFIKNSLNTIFEPVKNYFCPQNNDHTLLQSFKNWVKNQNKLSQLGVFIVSFLFISAITNAIKTYAADVTQNKGDWKKAWIQFKETFPKLGMVLSALGVTSSDLYNLTNKMKPAFKLIYKQEEQQKIIDEVLSELPNIINQANGNAASDGRDFLTRRINGHINNINEWDENDVQDINNSDREYLIPNNNRNHDRSLIQCVTI
ncbi:hypothetical protein [Spiroplasma endosymbiont of Tiphia femorata]|uniref:hypothetical protein n=3 Tax=unclassified Spiroplasma TaxID=2637901 RepID=UPI0030D30CB5